MTAKPMTSSQIARFTRFCEDQGCRITRTKKGLLIRFPDGTSTVQHFTNSDYRATQNQIARFRRAGVVHPDDKREQTTELPTYVTETTSVARKTRDRVMKYLANNDYPEVVYGNRISSEMGIEPITAQRALYLMGFAPGKIENQRKGRPWYTPAEVLDMKPKKVPQQLPSPPTEPTPVDEAIDDAINRARWAQQAINELGAGKPEPEKPEAEPVVEKTEEVDFIDERDSWVVDLEELLGGLYPMVRDRLSMINVLGMEYEFRVWRRK